MNPQDYTTRYACNVAIATLKQRRSDLEGIREFKFSEQYCIGGSPVAYVYREPEAMVHLRNELAEGGIDPNLINSLTWDELVDRYGARYGIEKLNTYSFDVTRPDCHTSILFVTIS